MSEKESQTTSTQEETKPETEAITSSEPSQPSKNTEPETAEEPILATGLEDYGHWKSVFKDQKREGKPPYPRRGRIWA